MCHSVGFDPLKYTHKKNWNYYFLLLFKGLCYVWQQGSELWGCSGWWQHGKQGRTTSSPAALRTSAPVSVQLLGVIPILFPSGFALYQQWIYMAISYQHEQSHVKLNLPPLPLHSWHDSEDNLSVGDCFTFWPHRLDTEWVMFVTFNCSMMSKIQRFFWFGCLFFWSWQVSLKRCSV